LTIGGSQLDVALQYSPTPGLPIFAKQLTEMHHNEHRPPAEVQLSVTTGSSDGLTKAFEMLINSDDNVLVEAPTYSGALAALKVGLNA
jgi:DNA-binding transcriptional MocR family regulator